VGVKPPQTTIFAAISKPLELKHAPWRLFLNMNWLQDGAFRPYLAIPEINMAAEKLEIFWNQHKYKIPVHVSRLQMKFQRLPPYLRSRPT